jgi:xanthosine utilization system XapX-like protein
MSQAVSQVPADQKKERSLMGILRSLLRTRELGVLVVLLLLCVAMTFLSPYFLTTQNIFNVLRGMSTIGIMAIGMTMVIVSGGIDLSVGSLMAVSAMFAARLMTYNNLNPWLALLGGLGLGVALGAVNGLVITRIKVNPFIATLGMLSIARGLTYLLATGLLGSVASNIPMRRRGRPAEICGGSRDAQREQNRRAMSGAEAGTGAAGVRVGGGVPDQRVRPSAVGRGTGAALSAVAGDGGEWDATGFTGRACCAPGKHRGPRWLASCSVARNR